MGMMAEHSNHSQPNLAQEVMGTPCTNLNVFLELLGVGQPPVPGAAVGDEPRDGLRLVGREVHAVHRRVPPHVLVVVLRNQRNVRHATSAPNHATLNQE